MINLEKQIVEKLKACGYHISFAESCTGGLLASTIINVSGASNVIEESYITYSNRVKMKVLGVKKETLDTYTVYSLETSLEMAKGLKEKTNSEVCISVTGETESSEGNPCAYYFTIIINDDVYQEKGECTGSRNEIRIKQVKHILTKLLSLL